MRRHTAECRLPADHPAAAGHFPGNPIIPGAVLLREVVRVVAAGGGSVDEIRSAKFLRPVRPGERLSIAWEIRADGEIRFTCEAGDPARRVLAGTLRLRT